MKILPDKKIRTRYDDFYYEEVSQDDILKRMLRECGGFSIKDVKVDSSSEDGEIVLTVSKEKLEQFLQQAEKETKQYEYDMKYMTLKDEVGYDVAKRLIGTPIDPDILIEYLPSKELIQEDYALWLKLFELSCGYYGTDEGLLSIELAKKLASGKSIDEYPEQLLYHYYHYPEQDKSVCEVPFTKTKFLESVKEKQKTK